MKRSKALERLFCNSVDELTHDLLGIADVRSLRYVRVYYNKRMLMPAPIVQLIGTLSNLLAHHRPEVEVLTD